MSLDLRRLRGSDDQMLGVAVAVICCCPPIFRGEEGMTPGGNAELENVMVGSEKKKFPRESAIDD